MNALRRVELAERRVLAVSGADRRSFLQGLVTGDLRRLSRDRAMWAALLTPQGKYLFDFFLAQPSAERFLLETDGERASALLARLTMYRLRAEVAVADLGESHEVVAILGADAAAGAGLAAEAGAARPFDGGVLFVDPRHPDLGLRAVLPRGTPLPEPLAAAEPAPPEAYHDLRLSLGVPDSRDLLPEKSLPLECNFAELGGVSFDKGCYIGQEVTARMKHRGRLRKRLLPVDIRGAAAAGDPIHAEDGREAGELRSVRDGRGLALLRLDHLGGRLRAGDAEIRPFWPSWLKVEE